MNKKNVKKNFVPYVFLLIILIGIYYTVVVTNNTVNKISYGEFLTEIKNNNVEEVIITPNASSGVYEITGSLET